MENDDVNILGRKTVSILDNNMKTRLDNRFVVVLERCYESPLQNPYEHRYEPKVWGIVVPDVPTKIIDNRVGFGTAHVLEFRLIHHVMPSNWQFL